jgi:hypothetical protein
MNAPLAGVFQSLNPVAPATKDQDVTVSRAKLSRSPILRGVECGGGRLPDP